MSEEVEECNFIGADIEPIEIVPQINLSMGEVIFNKIRDDHFNAKMYTYKPTVQNVYLGGVEYRYLLSYLDTLLYGDTKLKQDSPNTRVLFGCVNIYEVNCQNHYHFHCEEEK